MTVEELSEVINEIGLKGDEKADVIRVVEACANRYLNYINSENSKNIPKTFEFEICDYIDYTTFLSYLGIEVDSREWKGWSTSTWGNDFGPTYESRYLVTKKRTKIVFPTSLYTMEKKDDVLKQVRSRRAKYESR